MDKRFRQIGFIHARLHRRNIIRHTPKFHDIVVEIGNRKSGARIAVARLPNGTGIQQILVAWLEMQSRKCLHRPRAERQNRNVALVVRKTALMMSMAKKAA